jgi:hypothetical protein
MPYDYLVPRIKTGIIASVTHDMRKDDWFNVELARVRAHDPIIANYISSQNDEDCRIAALLVYLIIESQMNADQMEDDLGVLEYNIKQKSITIKGAGYHRYEVIKTTNTIEPSVGSVMTQEQVDAAIGCSGIDVHIEVSK